MSKSRIFAVIGVILVLLQAVMSCLSLYKIVKLDVLPTRYTVMLISVLMVLLIIVIVLQFLGKLNIVGMVMSFIMSLALIWVFAAVSKTADVLENDIKAKETTQVLMEVVVLKDGGVADINELGGGVFGISTDEANYEYNLKTIELIEADFGHEVAVTEYTDNYSLSKALFSGEIDAMILNVAYENTLDEVYETLEEGNEWYLGVDKEGTRIVYTDKVKSIKDYTITVEKTGTSGFGTGSDNRVPIDTSVTPFVIYVSGIDVKGDISTVSRSDVNVIVCVNPVTKQILMVTTPRDSYLEIPGKTDNSKYNDKLTHAGLYGNGAEYSIATLENCYGVDIDYYLRVNFTSVVDIVDLLGGVNVYSEHAFRGRHGNFWFEAGYNEMNGEQALSFARERFTIEGGDYSRGRNHMELIKAILNKAMSPSILQSYTSLLDLVADNVETNMTTDEITEIVKMQLNDGASWNFVSYATAGTNNGAQELRYCWSDASNRLYVTILDEESVQVAADLMEMVLNGQTLEQSYIDSLSE